MTEGQSGLSRRSILRGVAGVAAAAALPGLAACNSGGSTPAAKAAAVLGWRAERSGTEGIIDALAWSQRLAGASLD